MNYTETLDFLFTAMPSFQRVGGDAYKPGLERIAAFCQHLGNPQRNYYIIHVAGTNGKGSVSHMLASILQQAGYRTGLFTSPHLVDFRERIKVNGKKSENNYMLREGDVLELYINDEFFETQNLFSAG